MSRKVLLWCSEDETVQVLERVLKELNVTVESCTDSEDAERLLREQRFDAVILDFETRDDVLGVQLLQSVRKGPLNATTLTVTVVPSGINVRDLFSLGANFLLYKPVSLDRARASLRAAHALMGRERRRSVRLPVHSKATIDHSSLENGQATLIDLSAEGTAIQSDRKLPSSSKVYFKFELPEQSSVVRLSAEVVWQDSTGRVGMRFVDIPQGSRRLLREWLGTEFERAQNRLVTTPAPDVRAALEEPASGNGDRALARLPGSAGNRRNQARRACLIGAEVYKANSDVPHRCTLTDISIGGCYVEMPTPLASGTKVEVQLRTRDLKLRTPGVVRSVHPGFGMGVRFELRSAQQKQQLERLVHQLADVQGLEYDAPTGPR